MGEPVARQSIAAAVHTQQAVYCACILHRWTILSTKVVTKNSFTQMKSTDDEIAILVRTIRPYFRDQIANTRIMFNLNAEF